MNGVGIENISYLAHSSKELYAFFITWKLKQLSTLQVQIIAGRLWYINDDGISMAPILKTNDLWYSKSSSF